MSLLHFSSSEPKTNLCSVHIAMDTAKLHQDQLLSKSGITDADGLSRSTLKVWFNGSFVGYLA